MKKLLLGAVFAALCFNDASAVSLQTKSSKKNVDTQLKQNMGTYYKGMVSLTNALVVGWVDSLSHAVNDPEFKDCKNALKTAKTSLDTVAKFTKALLERKKDSTVLGTSLNTATTRANNNLVNFNTAVNTLKNTVYWKHCGAQLRFSIFVITNTLRALSFPQTYFNVAGIKCSSAEGLVDGNGNSIQNNLVSANWTPTQPQSPGSKASVVIQSADALTANVANAVTAPIASVNYNAASTTTYNAATNTGYTSYQAPAQQTTTAPTGRVRRR